MPYYERKEPIQPKDFDLKRGDRVRITGTLEPLHPNIGTVLTAEYFQLSDAGWYIELT